MRDRWLRDAFAVSLPSPTVESEQINHPEHRPVTATNSIDEDEAVRLLMDYGISEEKAKVRLQVCLIFSRFSMMMMLLLFISLFSK